MSFTAALVLALAANAAVAPASGGEGVAATAQTSVQILRPIIVRQNGGLQGANVDTPSHQIARSGDIIRYEFQ